MRKCVLFPSTASCLIREELPARGSDEHELCHVGAADDERAAALPQQHGGPEPPNLRARRNLAALRRQDRLVHATPSWVRAAGHAHSYGQCALYTLRKQKHYILITSSPSTMKTMWQGIHLQGFWLTPLLYK